VTGTPLAAAQVLTSFSWKIRPRAGFSGGGGDKDRSILRWASMASPRPSRIRSTAASNPRCFRGRGVAEVMLGGFTALRQLSYPSEEDLKGFS
jgi:hypothetical protein